MSCLDLGSMERGETLINNCLFSDKLICRSINMQCYDFYILVTYLKLRLANCIEIRRSFSSVSWQLWQGEAATARRVLARNATFATPGFFVRLQAEARQSAGVCREQTLQLDVHVDDRKVGPGKVTFCPIFPIIFSHTLRY